MLFNAVEKYGRLITGLAFVIREKNSASFRSGVCKAKYGRFITGLAFVICEKNSATFRSGVCKAQILNPPQHMAGMTSED